MEENSPEEKKAIQFLGDFVEAFPSWREEIRRCIRGIREEADEIDKTHKNCTIAGIVGSSVSAVSGVLSILGLSLAPVTAGVSLVLTATGIGLGIGAGITGISTGVSEGIINYQKEKKANELIGKCSQLLNRATSQIDGSSDVHQDLNAVEEITQRLDSSFKGTLEDLPKKLPKFGSGGVEELIKHAKALKAVKRNPTLAALAKQASATGSKTRSSIQGIEQVDQAFKGTALAMSKGARVAGATFAGIFLVADAYFLVNDGIHLSKGAKAERASEIRKKADKLEEILKKLNQLYQDLKGTM